MPPDPPKWTYEIPWLILYKINDCFETVKLIQQYYNCTGIFQMDYSITSFQSLPFEIVI